MNYPTGVALDLDQERVYVCDAGNDQIHVFSTAGEYLFRFGSPGAGDGRLRISDFSHMAFDPKGYLFVADTGNNRVAVFDRNGNWVTSIKESPATAGCRRSTPDSPHWPFRTDFSTSATTPDTRSGSTRSATQ